MKKAASRHATIQKQIERGDIIGLRNTIRSEDFNRVIASSWLPLTYAVHREQRKVVEVFLEMGADVDLGRNGVTPIMIASGKGNVAIVNSLLAAGADPNVAIVDTDVDLVAGYTPLMAAAESGSEKSVKALLKSGSKPTATTITGKTAVDFAVIRENFELVSILIAAGCLPGAFALFKAVAIHSKVLTRKFLKAGADPNVISGWSEGWVMKGESPLGLAVRIRAGPIVALLIAAGADPNILSCSRSPLNLASLNGYTKITKMLLKSGARVNLANSWGTTALMSAAAEGDIQIVQLLLKSGADPKARLLSGESAMDFAMAAKHFKIAKILEKARKN